MNINRKQYLAKLASRKNNGFIKVITGIRRCGKSWLLFTHFKEHLLENGTDENHIIEIILSRFEDKKYRDPEIAYSYIKNRLRDDETYYIFLDEIHLMKDFKSILNSLIRIQNVDIYVTGSDDDILNDIIADGSGAPVDELHLYPLSFAEFMSVYNGNRYDGWNEYILYGGLPPVIQIQDRDQKTAFLKQLFDESFTSRISVRRKIRNRTELEELLKILASSVGSLINPKQLSDLFQYNMDIRISQTTLKNYIEYLSNISLLSIARRFDIRNKKYISTPMKYYFTDIGLRNCCMDFRQIGENRIMENAVYNELLIREFQVDAGVASFSIRNDDGQTVRKQLEVDFICNRGTKRYYIQSAFSIPDETRMQQIQEPFRRIDDFFKRVIITKDCPAPYYTENGVLVMSITDFLLDPGSLDY